MKKRKIRNIDRKLQFYTCFCLLIQQNNQNSNKSGFLLCAIDSNLNSHCFSSYEAAELEKKQFFVIIFRSIEILNQENYRQPNLPFSSISLNQYFSFH